MAKLSGIQILRTEDFDDESRAMMDKLAFVLNPFIEQTSRAFNAKAITVSENLNQQIKTFSVTVDSDGVPTGDTAFTHSVIPKASGMMVIRARNLTNINTYPTGGVLLSFSEKNNILTINHVTGLQADNEYELTVLVLGN